MYPSVKLHIDGKWREATGGGVLPTINPATGDQIGECPVAAEVDLEEAAEVADRGFRIWKAVSAFERSRIMRKAATLIRERHETIATLLTLEQGKPLAEARLEVIGAADTIDWFAEESRRTYGRIVPGRSGNVTQAVIREPVGPVAAFIPWNFPVNQAIRKISVALAAGCSAILKGTEEAPAACAEVVRAFLDAGVDPSALTLLYGVPADISHYLISHPSIRKVSFTGSTVVGKQLAALAGTHMKRATMELGGHAPVLVFDDADISNAVQVLVAAKYRNAGQVCTAPTRFLVHENRYEQFLDDFTNTVRKLVVGDGMNAQTTMGPLAHSRRVEAMQRLVDDAVDRGAKLHHGGRRIGNRGYFFEPTILANLPLSSLAMNEEPFGPIALINSFARDDDAFAEANRLPYGLAAYAFTTSAERQHRLANGVESGMLAVNHLALGLPETPFGGVQSSGYGSEGGTEAMEAYLNPKFVTLMN